MKDYGAETVLVVPAKALELWEGFKPFSTKIFELLRKNFSFISRNNAEENPIWKQIIPYCVISRKRRIFFATRSEKTGEQRLARQGTLGLGGHINPKDFKINDKMVIVNLEMNEVFDAMVMSASIREIEEEVEINWKDVERIECLGLIYTGSNKVSQDHIGVLIRIYVNSQNIKIKDPESFSGGDFSAKNDIISRNMEEWSKIALTVL